MTMNVALLLGAGIGVALYLIACAVGRKSPEVIICVESILLGAGIPSGLHLMYCAFQPEHLVHVSHRDGKTVDLASMDMTVNLGEWHAVEVFTGGFVGAFVCFVGIFAICKKAWLPRPPSVMGSIHIKS
jgi:hypothetical protein